MPPFGAPDYNPNSSPSKDLIPRPVLTEAGAYFLCLPVLLKSLPKILEPCRRQLSIAHRVLDIAMAEI